MRPPLLALVFSPPAGPWIAFTAGILVLLVVDRLLLGRTASVRSALLSTLGWMAVSLACGAGIWLGLGRGAGVPFFTGYLVEYSLSVDNIFVFILIFDYFQVPRAAQPRVLSWGVVGAMVLRGAMIAAGALLIARFHWVLYLFGVFLLVTGARMLFLREKTTGLEANPVLRFCRAVLPMARRNDGTRFLTVEEGRLCLTPLGLVLIVIECTDLVFAVDSVPAVFAITQNAFVVYTSNICAILGLRSLYFLLAGAMPHLRYLKTGLALVLAFIGAKMLLAPVFAVSNEVSLLVVAAVLVVAVLASRMAPKAAQPPA